MFFFLLGTAFRHDFEAMSTPSGVNFEPRACYATVTIPNTGSNDRDEKHQHTQTALSLFCHTLEMATMVNGCKWDIDLKDHPGQKISNLKSLRKLCRRFSCGFTLTWADTPVL